MKKRFTILIAAIAAIMMMALPWKVWAEDVTLTENFSSSAASTNNYDCNSSMSTAANQTDWNYAWTPSGNGTVFQSGIKLGKNKGTGSVSNSTMLSGITTGTSVTIKIYAARWNSDTGNLKVTYNGSNESKAPTNSAITSTSSQYSASDFTNSTDFTITKAENITAFTIETTANRILIDKVEVVYSTGGGTTQLSAPASFQCTSVGDGQASFSWNAVEHADGYTISYTPAGGGSESTTTITGVNNTTKTITGLINGTSYSCKIRANGSGSYSNSAYTSPAISVTPTAAQQYTITFNPGNGTCATTSQQYTEGTTITTFPTAIPSETCVDLGWVFVGWATSSINNTTTNPTISSHNVTGNATLYAVYAESESKEFDFAAIASANNWENGTRYSPVEISPISISASSGNGLYYSSDDTWRCYKNGSVTISTTSGSILSVTSNPSTTFTINNNGTASQSFTETTKFKSITVKYYATNTNYATSPDCTPTCDNPKFTVSGDSNGTEGTYFVTATVALSCETDGADIYYTTDGSTTPTASSTHYTVPFTVTANQTIKAIAIKADYNNSEVAEKAITIIDPYEASFTSGIYEEAFSSSLGLWHGYSVSGDETWSCNTTYQYAQMKGNSHANEDWLLSPKMSVVNNKLAISFDCVGRYAVANQIKACYSTDYPGYGNPNSYNWTDISETLPYNESGWDMQSVSVVLTGNFNNVYFAFKYISTTSNSGTFEMNNFKAKQCYPITYYANYENPTGTTADANSPYAVGAEVTILDCGFDAPDNTQEFTSWNTKADGSGYTKNPGQTIEMTTDGYELYAIWGEKCTAAATMDGSTITPTYVNDGGNKSYSLEFKSKVTDLGGCDITDYGFVYSTSVATPTIGTANCTKQKIGEAYTTANTEYTYNGITGVDKDVTYYVRSYAINAAGTAYGAVASITTEDFPTMTVTYNENGNTSHTQTIYKGDTEDLEEPANAAPANMTFAGWAEAEITKFATSAPAFVTEYEATDNKTFYAVYEYNCQTGEITKGWKRVDNASSLAKDDLLVIASEAQGKVAGSTISSGYMNEATASFNNGIMTNLGSGAAQLTLGGSSGAWTLTNSSSQALGATAVKTVVWGSGTTTWSISINNGVATIQNGTSSYGRFLHNVNSTRFTTYTSDPNVSMLLPQIYRYEDIAATKSYYVTSVTELDAATTIAVSTTTTLDHNVTINTYGYTINGILNADGYLIANKTESKIVVNNGGQLKASNAVKATVKKNITQDWVPASGIGWYTISTPTGSTGFGDVANLKPMDGDNRLYDIYRYKESTMTWENSIAAGFDDDMFEEGRGYLYRKGNTSALEFAGPVNIAASYVQDLSVTGETAIAGFALLGNPYSHNINLKHVTVNAGDNLDACYILSGEGAWGASIGNTADIAPCTGFLVQATADCKATIHKSQARNSKANADYIQFIVANNQYEDVTFALFDEGHGLNKINHRNSNIQQIYIPKDGESFAVATMADNTQSFNLNFKAMTMGQYKLSFKTKGEFNYLHVIDRMTGEDIDMLLEGEYSFIGSPQDNEARFIVRLGYLPNYDNNGSDIFAYQNGSDVIVSGEGELQIFDVMGRMVSTQNVSGTEKISVNAQGVYIFRLVGTEIKTQKIVVR